jgi:23S rRNA G2069 N7-methylase RlmK/C1962 C5-methylase RlmI
MIFNYIKCPLNKYTFKVKPIREWVENECEGLTLNLFAGYIKLNIEEIRNDIDVDALADYHKDALEFVKEWDGKKFDTILLDPPYSIRKSLEFYKGNKVSKFKRLKDEILRILNDGGKVITFGYHSVSMGKIRNFYLYKIALFSHGGAIHDTIASVEIKREK